MVYSENCINLKYLLQAINYCYLLWHRSKIAFKTAGVLLEQMRDKGVVALKYKVIILDEVHERSVESDLVLACVKQFMMKSNELRYKLILFLLLCRVMQLID